jgi:UDP-glucuronate 4-epimerase
VSTLITGGAGFIGSHLAELLSQQQDEPIVCLDNFNDYYDPMLKRANAERIGTLPCVDVIEGDFCDYVFTEELFAKHRFTYVLHLGAYAGVRISVERPAIYQQTNVGGTLSLLEAARRHPVSRFVLVSSSTVYGTGAGIPFEEDAPLGIPASPYGATKRAGELLGLTYHALHSVPVVCIRPFSVYGPGLRPDLALTIFTKAIEEGRELPLFGDGSVKRDFTHVSDICDGLVSAITADNAVGEAINLGHSEPIEMREIIRMIEHSLDKKANINRLPERPEDLPITFANLDKARRLLGYEPKVPIADGIGEFCEWYRNWHDGSLL